MPGIGAIVKAVGAKSLAKDAATQKQKVLSLERVKERKVVL